MNIILKTDFYKIAGHWNMCAEGTEYVYSYFEARKGSKFANITFFGLQYLIKHYLSPRITQENINEAAEICRYAIGNDEAFNHKGWQYILDKYEGRLPVSIKAVPEGLSIPADNVLFAVENTDPNCYWLTSYLESVLSHVWASCHVATLARECKNLLKDYLNQTSNNHSDLDFMLHCFGYRSVSSDESAGILGLSNLTSFYGTDTVPALKIGKDYYNANLRSLAFSVPAVEHAQMTSLGREGESTMIQTLLNRYPKGILSVVGDSFDYLNFIENFVCKQFKEQISAREGIFVCRPDSITPEYPKPELLTLWTIQTLWNSFGGTINSKGFKVLNSKLKMLWGDGINKDGIEKILRVVKNAGFSVECLVFGMGGNYLQNGIYRDYCRFAFKSSAQRRNGIWLDVQKQPRDISKTSKAGRLKLIKDENGQYKTVRQEQDGADCLREVFRNGSLLIDESFETIRERANNQ